MLMKAVITGNWDGSRVRPGKTFNAPDGARISWAVPAEDYDSGPDPAEQAPIALGQLAGKTSSFVEVMSKKDPGCPKKEEGRKMDVIT